MSSVRTFALLVCCPLAVSAIVVAPNASARDPLARQRGDAGRAPATRAPVVTKVDPPNWWTRHTWNPVRLLVRGRNLQGARIDTDRKDITVGLTSVNGAGTYAFIDVHVVDGAGAGRAGLRLTTAGGRVEVPFELIEPLERAGRFQGFSPDDVIYLIMPDRFANGDPANDRPPKSPYILDRSLGRYYHGGDLRGIIDRLPYLEDLGVTAIWMNPVYDNTDHPDYNEVIDGIAATDYHGFHAIDFYAVDEHLGDLATLRELVDKAHARGIKVIQDQVANHTCGYHPWVTDAPTPTWFNGSGERHLANTFQTHLLMDPRAPETVRRATLDGWFVDILPDLNQRDPEAARYIIQNSLWWVGMTGLDGIRQDTIPYVPRWFWRDWTAALGREYPHLRVIGEVLDGSAPFVSFFQGGRAQFDGVDSGLDTLFDYPLFYGIRKAFGEGRSIREAVNVLHQDWLYPAPANLVTLLGSHDVARFMNEAGATTDGLRLATTFLMTMRGTPQWYYGDEIAMPGGNDPDNRRGFPGGWREDRRNAFEPAGRTPAEQRVFEHTRTLMRLRRSLAPLRRGTLTHLQINEQSYVFARVHEGETVLVALNNDGRATTLTVDVSAVPLAEGAALTDQLGGAPPLKVEAGRVRMALGARSGAVFARSGRP